MGRSDSIAVRSWRVLSATARRVRDERAPEAAASIGFFAVFSFFPLLLVLVAVAGTVLSDVHTQEQILRYILRFVPVSRELVSTNMRALLRARGAVSAIGLVGLIWSATGAFAVLESNLNRAWPRARPRNVFLSRVMALALVAALVVMAVLFLALRAAVPLAANWAWLGEFLASYAGALHFAVRAAIVAFMFGVTVLLYRLVPAARVAWRDAAVGAGAAAVAFVLLTSGFTWYLNSRFASLSIVYGSLGALVALLTWIYLLALTVLVGAHLSASVGEERRPARPRDGKGEPRGAGRQGKGASSVGGAPVEPEGAEEGASIPPEDAEEGASLEER